MNPEILDEASHVLSAIQMTIQKLLPKKLFQPITRGENNEMSQSEFSAITFHNCLHNNLSSSYTSKNETVIRILTPNNCNVKVRIIIFIMFLSAGGAQKSEA